MTTMDLRFDRWFLPMAVPFGMGPKRSSVKITDGTLHVSMGWAFRAGIPLANITAAEPNDELVLGVGVHGWRGRYLVNGSTKGIVKLTIDPRVPAKVCGYPAKLRTLWVSVTEPDELIAACTAQRTN